MSEKSKKLLISYILPCYNIERFIGDCLDSIYQQTLTEDEFEVICVNDCTPDHTRDVIVEYQKRHANLIIIDHEKNKRVGAARNTGFHAAKGEYIWFIDPDDVIAADATCELLPILDRDNLDFIQFGHYWMTEDKKPIENPPFDLNCKFNTDVMSGVDFLHEYQKRGLTYADMHSGPFVRIWRRSFLVENKIIYPEVAYYEDQYQALHGLIAAKRMRNVNKSYYYYREVVSSYSHVPMSIAKRASQLVMCCEMMDLLNTYNVPDIIKRDVWQRYSGDMQYLQTHYVLFMPNKERNEFINLIKPALPTLWTWIQPDCRLLCKYPNLYKAITNLLNPIALRMRRMLKSK